MLSDLPVWAGEDIVRREMIVIQFTEDKTQYKSSMITALMLKIAKAVESEDFLLHLGRSRRQVFEFYNSLGGDRVSEIWSCSQQHLMRSRIGRAGRQ